MGAPSIPLNFLDHVCKQRRMNLPRTFGEVKLAPARAEKVRRNWQSAGYFGDAGKALWDSGFGKRRNEKPL